MKSEKGITLISLIVYVVAMIVVVAIITTLTGYFYRNIDTLQTGNEGAKQYTTFNSYFTNDINEKDNYVLTDESSSTKLIFANGNQYTYAGNDIYFNKIKICREIESCSFQYNTENKKVTVEMVINGKNYKNEYTCKKDI